MSTSEQSLQIPDWYQLRTVVFSHGWYDLPPFAWDESTKTLSFAAIVDHQPVDLEVRQPKRGEIIIKANFKGRSRQKLADLLHRVVSESLGLSLSFDKFYQLAGSDYDWAKERGAGPFLRGASVFEDAVKMLATTNCSWSLTRQMMTRLVDELGEETPSGRKAFPTPKAMARQPAEYYRTVIRTGYRSPFFPALAVAVHNESLPIASWSSFAGTTAELVKQIRSQPGFGPYAAENLCKLLGRFDGLGLDSWCLKKYPTIAGPIRGNVTHAIEKRYARFNEWKGLALWLDLTRDWHEQAPRAPSEPAFKKR
jgi:N-glycosylase/DNA lyase